MSLKLAVQIFTLVSCLGLAQTDSVSLQSEQFIEDMFTEPDAESDYSDLYDLIEYYIRNPVNLNHASVEDLRVLPYLDLSSAELIIEHRKAYGKFFSSNELYSVSKLPDGVVKKVLPFVTSGESSLSNSKELVRKNPHQFSLSMRTRILYDFQEQKGFRDRVFNGSPYKIYNRLSVNYSQKMEMGFLTEKDAGEKSYYDFYSGFLRIGRWAGFKNIIIGDYLVEFGQGLVLWSPYALSKGSDVIYSVKRNSRIIKPYKSCTENNFFRGAAAEFSLKQLDISSYYSRNALDANLDSLSGKITSTPLDGMHRTNNEISKLKSVFETSYGLCLKYSIPSYFSAGILYSSSEFNHPFKAPDIFDIKGSKFNYYSTYLDLSIKHINIFGEMACDGNAIAVISGLEFSPSAEFSYVLSVREYPENYSGLHGYGFGERSGAPQNERGIFNGFRWRTSFGIINFYYDQFKFPFATLRDPLPIQGYEFMVNYMTSPLTGLKFYSRLKLENKEITENINIYNNLIRRLRQSFRFEITYIPSKSLRVKTRMEYCKNYLKSAGIAEEGYLIFQDLRLQIKPIFTFYIRAIFFHTASYNSSIFEYENDMTGILSTVGLYGKGVRLYILVRCRLLKWISLSLKYSETYKPAESSIGTGYQNIDGNIDNSIGIQLDFNY